jgi:hypothetical protein
MKATPLNAAFNHRYSILYTFYGVLQAMQNNKSKESFLDRYCPQDKTISKEQVFSLLPARQQANRIRP